jgi:23S rRNA (cytidine1920-2'-O)/16S rRNA (cytidine1409-2'-O)-methyltransferase
MRRRLDAELVRRGLATSRRHAVEAIEAGRVAVGGAPATTPARLVAASEAISVAGDPPRFVSRGGDKLDAALTQFEISVAGRRALDAGASTGGFTDCLLQRGAARVVAVDVGRGQLAWSLRTDDRVVVMEQMNARTLTPDAIGGPVSVCVADLSFISLRVVAPALAACCDADADMVLLVKPQFEAGRADIGRGGIVRSPEVHRRVLGEVESALRAASVAMIDVMVSPLRGADGNIEFLAWSKAGSAAPLAPTRLDAVVAAAHRPIDPDGGA